MAATQRRDRVVCGTLSVGRLGAEDHRQAETDRGGRRQGDQPGDLAEAGLRAPAPRPESYALAERCRPLRILPRGIDIDPGRAEAFEGHGTGTLVRFAGTGNGFGGGNGGGGDQVLIQVGPGGFTDVGRIDVSGDPGGVIPSSPQ